MGEKIDNVRYIYPSVPFIEINDLKKSLVFLNRSDADYCFPIAEFPSSFQRAMKQERNGRSMPFCFSQIELFRTQDLERAYHDAGQFYWGSPQAWKTNTRVHLGAIRFPIPGWRVVDIDTEDDWSRAELMHRLFLINPKHIKEQ